MRLPIQTFSQLRAIKYIKPGSLPEIPKDFVARTIAYKNPKATLLYKDVQAYIKDLLHWLSVAESVCQSDEAKKLYGDREANEKFVGKLIRAAHDVRLRCIHSIVHPELYTTRASVEALTVYWQLAAQMGPAERRFVDCEFYVPGKGMSRFFAKEALKAGENPRKSHEYYNLLTRFVNMYPFAYETDQRVMGLWIDGFSELVIAHVVKLKLLEVKSKIEQYTKIALANKEMFLAESEREAREED